MKERIDAEMQVEIYYANTHPSLRDRLQNLGEQLDVEGGLRGL